jgi:hypothetical protein
MFVNLQVVLACRLVALEPDAEGPFFFVGLRVG